GSGTPAPAPAPSAPASQPTAAASAAPAPSPGMAAGAGQVQAMWPGILEAVKNRRRFTWILLSQNAQVTGFDGTTLQLGFPNPGARDNFASSGSEEVLKAVLAEQFQVNWRIEAVVGQGGGPAPAAQGSYAPPAPAYNPPPAQQQPQAPAAPQQSYEQAQRQAPAQQPPAQQAPPPVAPEDDVAEADDPDLVESALSGHDLIVRELGATVVEEYTNE
ncbi:DNA polymerase III subunit gamma and tau, partial [Streptomyces sp. Isolate_45]|nr:DNA polymerase III subunit gamma and tau [Streptomyces sp. Isolate_45]